MNDPSAYYTDGSYYEVQEARVGDIICYFNDTTYVNDHSGIIIDFDDNGFEGVCEDANLYYVESKWGEAGLYRHNGADCPYAEGHYPRYFRKTCNHDYEYTWISKLLHTKVCTKCGDTQTETHVVLSSSINQNAMGVFCSLCGGLTESGLILHPGSTNLPSTPNGSYILPNGIIVLDERDFEAYFAGTLVFINNDLLTMVA